MKRTLALSGMLLGMPLAAQAQWYVGGDVGANFVNDAHLTTSDGHSGDETLKTGYVFNIQGGYDFKGPKLEAEIGYRRNAIDTIGEHRPDGGHTSSLAFMGNALYEFLPNASWHPFLGAGIGVTRISADWENDGKAFVKDSDWQFAWQAMAGISYDIDANWGLRGQYRYFATHDPQFTNQDGATLDSQYKNHAVLIGTTYRFNRAQ